MRRFNPTRDKLPGTKERAPEAPRAEVRTARAAPGARPPHAPRPSNPFSGEVEYLPAPDAPFGIDWSVIGVGRPYATPEDYLRAVYGPRREVRTPAEYLAPVFPELPEAVPYTVRSRG